MTVTIHCSHKHLQTMLSLSLCIHRCYASLALMEGRLLSLVFSSVRFAVRWSSERECFGAHSYIGSEVASSLDPCTMTQGGSSLHHFTPQSSLHTPIVNKWSFTLTFVPCHSFTHLFRGSNVSLFDQHLR